jgi:hypothetical protein
MRVPTLPGVFDVDSEIAARDPPLNDGLSGFVKTWEGTDRFQVKIARFRGKWIPRVFAPSQWL